MMHTNQKIEDKSGSQEKNIVKAPPNKNDAR
jgi:hypothetical protein